MTGNLNVTSGEKKKRKNFQYIRKISFENVPMNSHTLSICSCTHLLGSKTQHADFLTKTLRAKTRKMDLKTRSDPQDSKLTHKFKVAWSDFDKSVKTDALPRCPPDG